MSSESPGRVTVAASRPRNTATIAFHEMAPRSLDALVIPLALASGFLVLYCLTATNFHTFDGISYIRDMSKPLAAMVLPHHLIYEPTILGFWNLWKALGWQGQADLPAEVLSALSGAGALAVFYKLAWELSRRRAMALVSTLALAFSYGFWFYSVEVEIYVPPLLFLLTAAWLLNRAVKGNNDALFWLTGASQATAALIHQGSLFIVPAFTLGILLMPGSWTRRGLAVLRYLVAVGLVVGPAYLLAGVVIAGQSTPADFVRWVNHYGSLGTWGAWRRDSLDATVSGLSAAVSAEFWTGRVLATALFAYVLARAVPITKKGRAFAAFLCAWFAIYGVFFAWWQPENLKFWVLMLPAPLLLAALSPDWERIPAKLGHVALGVGGALVALLLVTNTPAVLARRDPFTDPARQMSAEIARQSAAEDLIVLQAGSAEEYLPFYYKRINILSMRELWYVLGGAGKGDQAVQAILKRAWHALAKGSSIWIEDRVLISGEQISDHYVFTPEQIDRLLSPYGEKLAPEKVAAGPETFYRLSPDNAYSKDTDWRFTQNRAGWSGVNIGAEQIGTKGWCFSPGNDPNLYGPPVKVDAADILQVEFGISSTAAGKAQLFFRTDPEKPYFEVQSLSFDIMPGERFYVLPVKSVTGWQGTIRGIRFDPVESGVTSGVQNSMCVSSITLTRPGRHGAGDQNTR